MLGPCFDTAVWQTTMLSPKTQSKLVHACTKANGGAMCDQGRNMVAPGKDATRVSHKAQRPTMKRIKRAAARLRQAFAPTRPEIYDTSNSKLLGELMRMRQPLEVCWLLPTPQWYLNLTSDKPKLYHKSEGIKSRSLYVAASKTDADRVTLFGILDDGGVWNLTIERGQPRAGRACHGATLTIYEDVYADRVIKEPDVAPDDGQPVCAGSKPVR